MADHKSEAEQAATAGKWDIANYHATMFKAQQQQVANAIALSTWEWTDGEKRVFNTDERAMELRDFAHERLGLA